jgi:hypothetical protein
MKYETPELTALTPAIDAVQSVGKGIEVVQDGPTLEASAAYADWED